MRGPRRQTFKLPCHRECCYIPLPLMQTPVTALVDTSVELAAFFTRPTVYKEVVHWGDWTGTVDLLRFETLVINGKTREQSNRILDHIKQIATYAKRGKVRLFTSDELRFERNGLRLPNIRISEYFALADVPFQKADCPVSREYVVQTKEAMDNEWHFFLDCIHNPRFHEINKATQGHHQADVFHLWTAEYNRLQFYISLDQRFINALRNSRKLRTPVQVLTPTEFSELLTAG
jgi:hypothetical protein